MEAFWKAAAIVLMTVILGTALGKTEKDMAVLLTLAACCAVLLAAVPYLSEVVTFLRQLGGSLMTENPFVDILLKITGVSLITELTGLISADAGSGALGKALQFLGNAVILCLSIPLFEAFLALIQEILGCL